MTATLRTAAAAALVAIPLAIAGCAARVPYVPPAMPMPSAYKEVAVDPSVLQPAQPSDAAPRAEWWSVFGDARLDDLESKLMAGNPSLAQGEARFRQARALTAHDRAAYMPTVTAGTSVQNSHGATGGGTSGSGASLSATQFDVSAGVSWEPDFWGRVRQTVAADVASSQAAAGDLESARLSLSATLAFDYFQVRSFDAELALLNATIEANQRSYDLTLNQYNAGLVARLDVAQAETLLEEARAQVLESQLARAQTEHAIAVLVGVPPAALTLDSMPLAGDPPSVPSELPSRLLERRPDIAAAERRAAAANAEIGVASAAFFPSLGLTASGGFRATSLADWLSWPSRFWTLGPALALTVFDGGARRAARANAYAVYDEEAGSYRQVVLSALQDVEDNLAAEHLLALEAERERQAVAAAQTALDVSLNQYRAGLVSYLPVATAQSTLLSNQRALVNLDARRFDAAVQLIKALGGGWDLRRDGLAGTH
jgi:NodT family efflux transporter outer membrane factor (OMF) lipoprotein